MSINQAMRYLEKLDANEDFRREIVPIGTPKSKILFAAFVNHGKTDGFVFTVEDLGVAVGEIQKKHLQVPITVTINGASVVAGRCQEDFVPQESSANLQRPSVLVHC